MPNVILPQVNLPIPSTTSVIGNKFTMPWYAAFHKMWDALFGTAVPVSQPSPSSGGPYTFTAAQNGSLVVNGSVSKVVLVRGKAKVTLPASLPQVSLHTGDQLVLTYSTAPALVWIPA